MRFPLVMRSKYERALRAARFLKRQKRKLEIEVRDYIDTGEASAEIIERLKHENSELKQQLDRVKVEVGVLPPLVEKALKDRAYTPEIGRANRIYAENAIRNGTDEQEVIAAILDGEDVEF